MSEQTKDIGAWRAEIDALDREILRLLNARAQLAVNIGVIKRERGLVVLDLPRERASLAKITALNEASGAKVLDAAAVKSVFQTVIVECRRIAAARNNLKLETGDEA